MNQTMPRIPLPALFAPSASDTITAEPQARGRIVIAEDNVSARKLLCDIFTHAGFSVHACKNGSLACQAVRSERPDVVLLDWIMPVMDGLRVAELLKADVGTRAIPIVIITALSQPEDRNLAIKAGVQDFVAKPFDVRELLACIEQQMRWRTIISTARAVDRRSRVTG